MKVKKTKKEPNKEKTIKPHLHQQPDVEDEVKKYTIFDHWKNLTTLKEGYKDGDPEFTSSYQPYMINKFAGTISALLPLVAEIDRYPDVPNKAHYIFYDSVLPKRYMKLDFMKKAKEESFVVENKEYVQKYFEFGKRDLELAMKIMTTEEIEKIKRMYGGTKR